MAPSGRRSPLPYPPVIEHVAGLELPESNWVDVGCRVHYREWPGPDDGPTFVCVHGLGGSLVNWALVAPGLAGHGRVLALDLGGFGLTDPGDRATDVGSNRTLLNGFIGELDLQRVTLVGNSMGGMVSLIQAVHAPRTVERLILTDAAFPRTRSPRGQFNPRVAAVFALYSNRRVGEWLMTARARRLGAEGVVRETLRIATANPATVDPRLVEAMIQLVERRVAFHYSNRAFLDAARSIFKAQVSPGRYRELVRRIRQPALVMHGALDKLVPVAAAREAMAGHDNWKLVVFPGLGHIPMMEAPSRWLQAVDSWLGGEVGTSPTRPEPETAAG
jgi:pimeloyl-ACP methyl ester carboxylesterase